MSEPTESARRRARRLRKEPTHAEKACWSLLRDRRLDGLKFRRQAPFGPFVVDFLCHEARLVLELDGGVHRLRAYEDAARDALIRTQGYKVLRFTNETLLTRPHVVVETVRAAVGRPPSPLIRLASRATFSPEGRRDT